MAQTNYIETSGLSYCGTEAQEIYSKDIYSLDLRRAGVTYIDGVKGKRKIYMGQWDNAWQAYTCNFSPDGQVSLSEAFVEVVPIKVNKEFCQNEFWDSFLVEQTEISLRGGIPNTFAVWYFTKLRQEMAKEYAEIAWQGDVDYSGTTKQYLKITDGWEKLLESNSAVTSISGAVFTVDNVLAQVEAVIQAGIAKAAENEWTTDSYKVLMNKYDIELVKMALGKICCPNNDSIFSNYAKGADGGVFVYGFELIPTDMSRNKIIFGDPRNLVLAFDTFDSRLEYRIISMKEHTLDDSWRVGAISNIGTAVVFPEIFVISKP